MNDSPLCECCADRVASHCDDSVGYMLLCDVCYAAVVSDIG